MNTSTQRVYLPSAAKPSEAEGTPTPAKCLFKSLVHWFANYYLLSETVYAQLNPHSYNRVALKLIASVQVGDGSPALEHLCSLADVAECEIILAVSPQKIEHTRRLTKPQLVKWYKKRGFVKSSEYTGDTFIRFPKK